MSEQLIPVVTADRREEVAPDIYQLMANGGKIPDGNFADDQDTKRFFLEHIWPLMTNTKYMRKNLEDEWRAIENMEMLRHDEGQKYLGRSNVYLPVFNRSLSTLTSSLVQGLFPSDEYMDVSSRSVENEEAAKATKDYLQWEFDTNAQVRARIKPALRQLAKFGTSPIKYWYAKDLQSEGRLNVKQLLTGALQSDFDYRQICSEGFRISPRSAFNVYVYPWTASNMDEASMVYEIIEVPKSFVEDMGADGRWKNTERGIASARDPNFDFNQKAEMATYAETIAPSSAIGTEHPYRPITITEMWVRMRVPKKFLLPGEDVDDMVPCKLVFAGDVLMEACRNPFWHQKPPYLFARMNVKPGFFYGDGFGRSNRALQYLANDFMNQTNDCGIYALNPILKVNPATVVGPLPRIRPGAVWKMTDLNGTAFERPPVELMQYGLQMSNSVIGMAQDFGGAPPVLQGSKGAKTATASQLLQKNAMGPLQDIIEDFELDVLVPMLKGAWSLAQQYRDPQFVMRVAGRDIKMDKNQLAIDAEFRWLASSQSSNQAARAQQVMQFMQMIQPMIPLLQSMGKTFDPTPLLQRVYSDGFGFRGFDQVIKDMPPPPPMGMQPPGAPPPGGGPQGPDLFGAGARVRSAVEQQPGGPLAEPMPGEGEDFMDVRNQADQLAAMQGGGYGGNGE